MDHKKSEPYCFVGVFILGLALVLITGNYYLNKEAGEDREARTRRIATELDGLRHTASSAKILDRHQAGN
jgi:hypothetical protein